MNVWDRCHVCNRPKMCSSNAWKLRGMVLGCGCAGFALGALSLSTLGFGDGGVTAASVAASWQSGIGNVATSSIFATLTSLGAKGTGVFLFGGSGAALGALAPLALQLGWCEKSGSKECFTHFYDKNVKKGKN